ncbi:MAG: GNAT family N-acetyltransferase, partial [Anaerolineales bacterium]
MNIEFIHQIEKFESVQEEWDQLLDSAITNTPFQRHEYQKVWWSTRGGGEWDSGDLWVAIGRSKEGELAGVAPLFFRQNVEGAPTLLFMGSIEISDYLDLIVSEERLDEFIAALFDALSEGGPQGWEQLDLYNIPEDSPSLAALKSNAEAKGWEFEQERLQPCPILDLPESWDAYLDQIDSKQARELRRKLRKAQGYPASVDWHMVTDREELDQAVDKLIELMANDSAKEKFLTEAMRTHFHRMCAAAFESGWLQLAFLTVSHEAVFG